MKTIETVEELDELIASSADRPVVIFKHSNTCPISSRAHREMRRLVEEGSGAGFAMVVVQQARGLSSEIEGRFGLRHESPQAIVVRDGRAVWNASHFEITRERVASALEES